MKRRMVRAKARSSACGGAAALVLTLALVLGIPCAAGALSRAAKDRHAPSFGAPIDRAGAVFAPSLAGTLQAPVVTLTPPPLRSNQTSPRFSGTASDITAVTVEVFEGPTVEGRMVATATASGSGGSWTSSGAWPPLVNGTYTAVAKQASSMGAGTGTSNVVTFEVNSESPTVTLAPLPSPSNDRTPSFSGTASEPGQVTVEIFAGSRPEGRLLAIASATVAEGASSWRSAGSAPALPGGSGTFTALAVQTTHAGGAPGESAPVTFVLDTEAPRLTLKAPISPSHNTTPSFSGSTSEAGQVSVEIFNGPTAEGAPVASAGATAPAPGSWSSSGAGPALGDGTYTAVAVQASAIGNPTGRSAAVTFVVDSSAPRVRMNSPPSPSANQEPAFSGTASDNTPVTVRVYRGASAEGAAVTSATAEVSAGSWVSTRVSAPLEWGEYTAVASQPSSLENPTGFSPPVTFVVAHIPPALATETAAAVTRTSAALYASVDPRGAEVKACAFEYGTDASYGKVVECGFVHEMSAFPSAGTEAVQVFARVYGLSPATAYHFRIVAAGPGGTAYGADQTFTTLPPWLFGEEGSPGARAGVSSFTSARSEAARIAAQIAKRLALGGRAARIASMVKSGVFRERFRASVAGRLTLAWYYSRPATGQRRPAQAVLLVAAGTATPRSPASDTLTVRLTGAGRRLFARAAHLRLNASCAFTPAGAAPQRASALIDLAR